MFFLITNFLQEVILKTFHGDRFLLESTKNHFGSLAVLFMLAQVLFFKTVVIQFHRLLVQHHFINKRAPTFFQFLGCFFLTNITSKKGTNFKSIHTQLLTQIHVICVNRYVIHNVQVLIWNFFEIFGLMITEVIGLD